MTDYVYFKYRIYPNKKQEKLLETQLETCRQLYNLSLEQKIWAWRSQRKSIGTYEQMKQLTELRREFEEFKNVHVHALQNVIKRVDKSFLRFFGGSGFPRYKNAGKLKTIKYNNVGVKFLNNESKIYISKIGKIKIKKSREMVGKIVNFQITTNSTSEWYIIVTLFDKNKNILIMNKSENKIGIDLGIEKFATFSDGSMVKNPRYFNKYINQISCLQKSKINKIKNSNNNNKLDKLINKKYLKMKNCRKDFYLKLSNSIIKNYNTIFYEDLNINSMIKFNKYKNLKKLIYDAGWHKFIEILKFKAERAGIKVISVDPKFTSQTCSSCGIIEKKELSTRIHNCICGFSIDRDWNAAINILRLGQSLVLAS